MEMVATAKIKKAQDRHRVGAAVRAGDDGGPRQRRPLRPGRRRIRCSRCTTSTSASIVIPVTSDRGLAGAFNSNILRLTESIIAVGAREGRRGRHHRRGQEGASNYFRYREIEPLALVPRHLRQADVRRRPRDRRRGHRALHVRRDRRRRRSSSTASRTWPSRSPRSTSCSPSSDDARRGRRAAVEQGHPAGVHVRAGRRDRPGAAAAHATSRRSSSARSWSRPPPSRALAAPP